MTIGALVYASPVSANSEVVHGSKPKAAHGSRPTRTKNLSFHGGSIGVQTAPKVYLVTWSWGGSDPSGEEAYYTNFLNGVGGSAWNNSDTQYCENVPSGTTNCANYPSAPRGGNPANILAGVWDDIVNSAPSQPTQSQLAAEAVRAASHFGNTSSASNVTTQYIIATAHGKSSSGFGTQYCAWHSSTSSAYGNLAYTNLPYITDAGASCGQNFVNGGSAGNLDGVSIVGGHEMAETESDPFPNSGWLDSGGAENGDKCAWIGSGQGASQNISLSTGTFAVQSLWSNAFNNNAGGCVVSYP